MNWLARTFALTMALLLCSLSAIVRAQTAEGAGSPADKAEQAEKERLDSHWKAWCEPAFEKSRHGVSGHILLTGPPSGYYFKVGKAITSVLADGRRSVDPELLEIKAVSTDQTSCNLLGLETGHAQFALVQSDVAHDAWFGHPPIRTVPATDISLVAPLYVEAVHIVVRPHLNLAQLSDLRGRRVWLGIENSLTVLTARRVLDAAGLTTEQIDALNGCPRGNRCPEDSIGRWSTAQALKSLENLNLDAMFQVGAVPFDNLRDQIVPSETDGQLLDLERNKKPCAAIQQARVNDPGLRDHELHLFSLDLNLVDRLVRDGSYIEQLIPSDAYCQENTALTVGVRALLLTNRPASDRLVHQLAAAILANQYAIERNLREQMEVEQKNHGDAITGVPSRLALLRVPSPETLLVRYHPTIKNNGDYFHPWMNFLKRTAPAIAAGLLILFLVLYRWRRVLGPWVVRHGEWPAGLAGLGILWVSIALVVKHYEGNVNEDFSSVSAAMITTLKCVLRLADGPVTRDSLYWWSLSKYAAGAIFVGALVPMFRQSVLPRVSAALKNWLLGLGQQQAAPPAPQAVEKNAAPATDPATPPHPAPSH